METGRGDMEIEREGMESKITTSIVLFPKKQDGRSFQGDWYDENPWLEYFLQNDALYCFSCRPFTNDKKYKSRSAWRSVGLNRQAKV